MIYDAISVTFHIIISKLKKSKNAEYNLIIYYLIQKIFMLKPEMQNRQTLKNKMTMHLTQNELKAQLNSRIYYLNRILDVKLFSDLCLCNLHSNNDLRGTLY